jgi:hypothetical protein
MGLAGRRVYPFSRLGSAGQLRTIDQGAQIQGDRVVGQEEFRDITPRAVYIYTQRIEHSIAEKLAQRIIQQRRQYPFMAWRTNSERQPGFEDFIDSLSPDFFPSPTTCVVIDPDQPNNRQIESVVLRGGSPELQRMWLKGTGPSQTRSLRRQKGLAFHEQNGFYFDLIKGVIKSNFNPNTRINRYNPNVPAYIAVDKSDLVWAKDRFTLLKGHTTEFCFDSNGIFEVTTLGQIAEKGKGRGPTTVVAGQREPDIGKIVFPRSQRSIVQVYNVLRHTNQYQFEKTFVAGSRSSKNDRKYIVTWPDPMAALTELISGGSLRDGRVEIAGLLDGRRLEAPIQQRTQLLSKSQGLTMAHTFQDRDSQSISNLQRVVSQGAKSNFSDTLTTALREVLNPPYTRQSRQQFGRYVSRLELNQLGGTSNFQAQFFDPLVQKEALGTDLMPDGLHSSLLTTTHLQAHVLLLPARQRIGAVGIGGDSDPRIGASGRGTRGNNLLGNVPYYKGGLAFWVKFDFDGDDPVFSGLIGCTQVIKGVSQNASDFTGSEGRSFLSSRT